MSDIQFVYESILADVRSYNDDEISPVELAAAVEAVRSELVERVARENDLKEGTVVLAVDERVETIDRRVEA